MNRLVAALEITGHLGVQWSTHPAEPTDDELREASVAGRLWKDREGALTWVRGSE